MKAVATLPLQKGYIYISPQAVSRAVGNLERELGLELLHKSRQEMQVTPIGAKLYEAALKVVSDMEAIESTIGALRRVERSMPNLTLAIATPAARGNWLDIEILPELMRRCPNTKIEYLFDSNGACLLAVKEGIVDAAIALGKRNAESELSCKKVASCSLSVAVSSGHFLARRSSLDLEDIVMQKIAIPSDIVYCYPTIRARFAGKSLNPHFVNCPYGAERTFLEEDQGVIFIAGSHTLSKDLSGCAIIPLSANSEITIPVYFIEKKEKSNDTTRQIASLLALSNVSRI